MTLRAKLIAERLEGDLSEAGLSQEQIGNLSHRLYKLAKDKMNGEYTVVGGYPMSDQIVTKAVEIAYQLDEDEQLETLLDTTASQTAEVAETDLEDAYNAADSIQFVGSEKQIKWARSIATSADESIARAWKQKDFKLPTSAKWWIDSRDDIYQALLSL